MQATGTPAPCSRVLRLPYDDLSDVNTHLTECSGDKHSHCGFVIARAPAWLPALQAAEPGPCCRNPTWGNHRNIFADSGVEWKNYRYFDPSTVGLDFKGLMEDIRGAPDGSIVVLHGAGPAIHNCCLWIRRPAIQRQQFKMERRAGAFCLAGSKMVGLQRRHQTAAASLSAWSVIARS